MTYGSRHARRTPTSNLYFCLLWHREGHCKVNPAKQDRTTLPILATDASSKKYCGQRSVHISMKEEHSNAQADSILHCFGLLSNLLFTKEANNTPPNCVIIEPAHHHCRILHWQLITTCPRPSFRIQLIVAAMGTVFTEPMPMASNIACNNQRIIAY
jgi:hypothetical protein